MTKCSPQLFFSVGEPSGDQHTARLIQTLASGPTAWRFRGFGGPQMQQSGCRIDYDLTQMAVMGLVEVIPKLRQFFRIADIASDIFRHQRPDAVVLVDFPGFNWHIAKRAKRLGIPVIYYLPPQLWAWGSWRIGKVRRNVDHVLSVLPFEHQWYVDRGIPSTFVGHPFFDAIAEQPLDRRLLKKLSGRMPQRTPNDPPQDSLVAVLPGSRSHEVQRNWPTMLESIRQLHRRFPRARFAVAAFRDAHCLWCRNQMNPGDRDLPIDFFVGKTSEVIEAAHCAMMVSGSVSLELMARGTPAAVIYQTGRVMYAAGRAMVRVPSITLPNLIAGQQVFPEMALPGQTEKGVRFLVDSLSPMLGDPEHYRRLQDQLTELRVRYAAAGATQQAAERLEQIVGSPAGTPSRKPHRSDAETQHPVAA